MKNKKRKGILTIYFCLLSTFVAKADPKISGEFVAFVIVAFLLLITLFVFLIKLNNSKVKESVKFLASIWLLYSAWVWFWLGFYLTFFPTTSAQNVIEHQLATIKTYSIKSFILSPFGWVLLTMCVVGILIWIYRKSGKTFLKE